jgi:ABC-type lipopolysaccharide export system ATPase subunit
VKKRILGSGYAGYGGRDCRFDVSLAFARGEITGLIGPKGGANAHPKTSDIQS